MNDFSWIGPTLKLVASGALETIIIAVASVAIAVALGVILGVLLCLPAGHWNNAVRWALTLYLQLFRGLPVLVTLFIVFFEIFIDPLESGLGVKSSHTIGRSHSAMDK